MKRPVTSTRKPVVLIDRVCDGLDAVVLDNMKGVFDATSASTRGRRRGA